MNTRMTMQESPATLYRTQYTDLVTKLHEKLWNMDPEKLALAYRGVDARHTILCAIWPDGFDNMVPCQTGLSPIFSPWRLEEVLATVAKQHIDGLLNDIMYMKSRIELHVNNMSDNDLKAIIDGSRSVAYQVICALRSMQYYRPPEFFLEGTMSVDQNEMFKAMVNHTIDCINKRCQVSRSICV